MRLKARLKTIDLPDYGAAPDVPSPPSAGRLLQRIVTVRERMEQRGITHLVVYADREHTANLAWLTNFDARFEEAMLVLSHARDPLLITGNECAGYLGISALHGEGRLRHELFQDFSLLDQPRDRSRTLRDILGGEGIGQGAKIGIVGWKYFADPHHLDIPSYIADLLRDLTGRENVINAADMFMHAGHGLRSIIGAEDIPTFEFANWHASEAMKRILLGLKEGMTDFEAASLAGTNGLPLGCHMTFATAAHRDIGLASPTGQHITRGSPLSFNLSYWRANVCRAGWVATDGTDLPANARDYVERFAGPYVSALAEWFRLLGIGMEGGELQKVIDDLLPLDEFGITLNPGHLIDIDEWVSSPIYRGSNLPLRSGMAIQCDIIPFSGIYGSTRMEDGYVLADAGMRAEIRRIAPAVHARCMARRQFMESVIGLALPEDVLPLSNLAGIVQPYMLAPDQVIVLS